MVRFSARVIVDGSSSMKLVSSRASCLLIASTSLSRLMISWASSGLRSMKAVTLSRNMPSAICAMRGISMSGLSSGSLFSSIERRAMADGLVGDALEVAGDFRGDEHEAAVGGDRRVGGHVVDDQFVDADLEFVELGILRFDRGGELLVALDQRAHGQGEVAVGQAGHHEERLADIRDLFGGGAVGIGALGGIGMGGMTKTAKDQPKRVR